jgi:hypothetical protein
MPPGVLIHLIIPVCDLEEAVLVGDVVEDDDAVGVAVVGVGDGAEAVLAGGVPLR